MSDPKETLIVRDVAINEGDKEETKEVDRKSLCVSMFTLIFSIPAIVGS
jgi:hypothetical protein